MGPRRQAIALLPLKFLISTGPLLVSASLGLGGVQCEMWCLAQSEVIREVAMRYQIFLWAQGSRDFGNRTPTQLDKDRFAEELDSDDYVASFGCHPPAKEILPALLDPPPRLENSVEYNRGK